MKAGNSTVHSKDREIGFAPSPPQHPFQLSPSNDLFPMVDLATFVPESFENPPSTFFKGNGREAMVPYVYYTVDKFGTFSNVTVKSLPGKQNV